jgi:leucyl/phenylalanyl-tRNA--protein transferase
MSKAIHPLVMGSLTFPPLENALDEPNGLLAFGGDLTNKRIISAYTNGIFPWFSEGEPIMWWSPNPRAVIFNNDIIINRTLRKVLKQKKFTVTLNKSFEQVIELCADAPFRKEGTWIIPEMLEAYVSLHKNGIAHSIEVWMNDELAGGLYGVAINGYFSGESMFYRQSNASKIALVYLSALLKDQGIEMIDCQMLNPFLEDMGCIEIDRNAFINKKDKAITIQLEHEFWQSRQLFPQL